MLLATKLFAPQQAPHYVERQRLHAKLRAALSCRIALVSAPAGFGKSTLLAGWIDSLRRESEGFGVAWLSLDEQDNNPNRFYTHLITAVHQANPTVGGDLLALLRLPQAPSGENLLGGLINDLSQRSAPLILILDDYHAIENRDLHKALVYLIEHSPPHLHVVIATRANPPFPLARWRLSGALLEIREQDLRFDSREIVEFLAQSVDLHLTSSDIAAVEQRTEGWVGALQLAAISLQDTGDPPSFLRKLSGSHAYIVDYLVEEVLSRQPPHIQQFLLHTSYLDRFCGDLCAAVTDEGDSEAILQHLYQQNLFTIALDDEHHWFRYHHLFRDMLRFRLRRSDPNAGAALQRAASRWCEENELLAEAVYYALSASDMARAAALIEDHYWSMLERSDFAQLADWLQSLPPDLIRAQPRLGLAQAWSLYATYNIPAIQACLDGVERAVEAADAAQLRSDPRFCAELLTLRASNAMYAGDSERAIVLAEKALAADVHNHPLIFCTNAISLGYAWNVSGRPDRSYTWAKAGSERGIEAGLPFHAAENQEIALFYLERIGAFEQGEAIIRRVLDAASAGDALAAFLSTSAHLFLSRYLLERYELDAAAEHALIAQQQAARLGIKYVLIKCHIQLMFVRQAQGRWQEAYTHLQTMWELSSSFSGFYLGWHAALAVYALTIHGDIEQAAVFASAAGLHDSGPVTAENEPDRSCLVWLIYAQDRLDEALDLADRLRAVHTELGRVRRQVEMWCLRALVLWRWRQEPQAFAALECALTIAMRYRLLYALLNKPRLLQEILRAYAAQSQSAVTASFARQVLAMAEGDPAPIADQESAPLLVEPISGRELEVLQLLAQGLTHRQIADQLVVAPGTIKRHLSNIYSKLGVHSRTQALARTRDLYLL